MAITAEPRHTRPSWPARAAIALVALIAIAAAGSAAGAGSGPGGALEPPNIILVRTDDQTLHSLRFMPQTQRLLAGQGTTFTQAVLSSPQCCPSRAAYLTGQYGHNNGVLSNSDAYGSLVDRGNVLPVWLRRAGYVTAHLGKWMDGYAAAVGDRNAVAPGWSHWFTAQKLRYYDYSVSLNGDPIHFGKKPGDYITRVLHRRAAQWITRYASGPHPLYLQLDERAPHDQRGLVSPGRCDVGVPVPDPRDRGRFSHEPLPHPPSFNERAIEDKPSFLRAQPRLGRREIREMKREYRCALESLWGVDRGVRSLMDAVRDAGALDTTIFIFTSDNGFFYGEHRVVSGKVLPYEAATNVPLVMRVPRSYRGGMARVGTVGRPVSNVDLAPTILDFAGAEPCNSDGCRILDGRSLVGLLSGGGAYPNDRGVAIEYSGHPTKHVCRYRAIHTVRYRYADYQRIQTEAGGSCAPSQERELYELARDPFELSNLYPADPATADGLAQVDLQLRLDRLAQCAGIPGRDPPQGARPFCE